MLVRLGAEWWPEPMEQPAHRAALHEYEVEDAVLSRWRDTRRDYLSARAALVGEIERQGWRAPGNADRIARPGAHVDVVFTAPPGGPDDPPAMFVEVEDDQGRGVGYGEWLEGGDGHWMLRIPLNESPDRG